MAPALADLDRSPELSLQTDRGFQQQPNQPASLDRATHHGGIKAVRADLDSIRSATNARGKASSAVHGPVLDLLDHVTSACLEQEEKESR